MTKFQIQNASSNINWTGKKVLGLHTGSINVNSGFIEFNNGLVVGGRVEIDMTSIVITDIEDKKSHDEFLAHLQNDDFFSTDKFKTAHLDILSATANGNNQVKIDGNLTIKGITNPISFVAKVEVFTDYLHAIGEMIIDRTLYNIRYGSGRFIANLGDTLIYDDFVLLFKLVGQKI